MKIVYASKPADAVDSPVNETTQAAPQFVAMDPTVANLLTEDAVEKAQERARIRESRLAKQKARMSGAHEAERAAAVLVLRCDHLKGKAGQRAFGAKVDYALSKHTFVDGTERIKCLKCALAVWNIRNHGKIPADTQQIIWRDRGNGYEQLPNPSYVKGNPKYPGIGWNEAVALLESTSNKESKSEVVMDNPQSVIAQSDAKLAAAQAKIAELEAKLGSQGLIEVDS
jgi:hypothetical protein